MQTSYSIEPAIAHAGMLADSRLVKHTQSRIASGPIKAGVGVFGVPGIGAPGSQMTDPGQVYQNPAGGGPADVDAIIAGPAASATTPQDFSSLAANGALGATDIHPERRATVTFSANANWLATTGVLTFVNADGATVTENIAIPAGGNATVTTTGYLRRFINFHVPAQGGTGGTFTVGVAAIDATVDIRDFEGIALLMVARESYQPTGVNAAEFGNGDTIPCLYKGAVWVNAENAVTDKDPVYVRTGAGAGGTQIGALRNDADGGTAALIPQARFARTATAGALTIVELY